MTTENSTSAPGNKKRTRRGRRSAPSAGKIAQKPFKQPLRGSNTPVSVASDDELESIHQASLRLLRDTGIAVLHDEARKMMAQAGATIGTDGVQVYFSPDLN